MASYEPELLRPGATFGGRYQVVRCIKSGGMGVIYEAVHVGTGRKVALKIMLPTLASDLDLRARFQLEARVAANVDSDHLVEVTDAGVEPDTGLPFLAMELLQGEDLGSILERNGPLAAKEVILLLYQLAMVLDKTHAAGILHRDLKPENLFVTIRDDGSPRLKVLDFGIAKLVAQGAGAKTTRNIGTPLYMSPEQMRGDGGIGPRADLYSLGHVAYTLLVGVPYWEPEAKQCDNHHALLLRVLGGAPEAARGRAALRDVHLPVGFDAWFERATALDPSRRFASASELVEELAGALNSSVPRPSLPSFCLRATGSSLPTDPQTPTLESPRPLSGTASTDPDTTGSVPSAVTGSPGAHRSRQTMVTVLGAVLVGSVALAWVYWSLTPKATDIDPVMTASPAEKVRARPVASNRTPPSEPLRSLRAASTEDAAQASTSPIAASPLVIKTANLPPKKPTSPAPFPRPAPLASAFDPTDVR